MKDEILSRLSHLTALVLELRKDQEVLRTEIKKVVAKHREINSLRASLAKLTAERNLLRKVESALNRLIVRDVPNRDFEEMTKKEFVYKRTQ